MPLLHSVAIGVILAILAVPAVAAALQLFAALHTRIVERIVRESGMSESDQAACLDSMDEARQRELPVIWYDCLAPIVMLFVLPFVPRGANKLPAMWRKWDNNISINGDGGGVQMPDGSWVEGYEVKDWEAVRGYLYVKYDDPRYGGDAYYAKGHHPRSFWARYIWLGWRNRATQASFDVGIDSGAPIITAAEGDGWRIRRSGDLWEVTSHQNNVRVYYGWKVYEAPGRVRPVTIGISWRRSES